MKSKFNLEKKVIVEDQNSININSTKDIYYFEINGDSEGPYSINDLLSKIKSNTIVYREGIDWTEAINVPELKFYFNKDERVKSIDRTMKNSQQIKTKSNKITFIIIGVVFLILIVVISFFLTNNNSKVISDTTIENNAINNSSSSSLNNNSNNSESSQNEKSGTWVVITGSYKSQDEAIHQLNKLLTKGITVELLNTNDFEKLSKDYYFVCAGKQLNKKSAQEISKQITEKGFEAYAKDAGSDKNSINTDMIKSRYIDIDNIFASSTMNSANNLNYLPTNIIDNNLNTWWSPKTNDKKPWIKIEFNEVKTIGSIEFHNGSHYLNFKNYGNLYMKNNRITNVKIEYSDGSFIYSNLEEVDEIQKLELIRKQTNYLLITIMDYKQGDTWDDICISHLRVLN